ncbi:hypothetical protein LXL04_031999 [Taraxacum kok-saghyz]
MADEIGAGGDDCFVHPELLQRRKESVVVESKSDSGLTCSLPVSRKRARDYGESETRHRRATQEKFTAINRGGGGRIIEETTSKRGIGGYSSIQCLIQCDMKNLIGEASCRICQENFNTTVTGDIPYLCCKESSK